MPPGRMEAQREPMHLRIRLVCRRQDDHRERSRNEGALVIWRPLERQSAGQSARLRAAFLRIYYVVRTAVTTEALESRNRTVA